MATRIVFAGTPAFSLPCLQTLLDSRQVEVVGVVTQPDRRSGRGMKLTPSPIKQAAIAAGIDCITPEKLRDNDEALAWLQNKYPDILVVVAFGMILPAAWLEAPTIAPLNIHASLLPRWRGAAPIERAFLTGDNETGVCLMRMEQGLDTGPIYACRTLPINGDCCGSSMWQQLSQLGAVLLHDTLPQLISGALTPLPQSDADSCYAAKLTADDRIIHWQQAATVIDRQVRCFAPKPGARCKISSGSLQGKWLKIVTGSVLHQSDAAAGSCHLADQAIVVGCGAATAYRIHTLQPEGKAVMAADAFWHGLRDNDLLTL